MTEAEWCESVRSAQMLDHLRDRASVRKLRLFAVASCHRVWDRLEDERSRRAIEVAEGVAEGSVDKQTQHDAWVVARAVAREIRNPGEYYAVDYEAACLADAACHAVGPSIQLYFTVGALEHAATHCRQGNDIVTGELPSILRDIYGNPFRPVAVDRAWQTATVVRLAQAIYDERAFARLPILADALDEAGCGDETILSHCRGPGPHVRGCWVVDLLLGKE
jgi:hypothetical protein